MIKGKKIIRYIIICLLFFITGVLSSIRIRHSSIYLVVNDKLHEVMDSFKKYPQSNVSEEMQITLSKKAWEKILSYRDIALTKTHIPKNCQDYVNAKLKYGKKEYSAKIGLTGGLIDHLTHPKQWSLKIKIKGDSLYSGMRKFALLVPDARGYLTDWVGHELLKSREVIALKKDFLKVSINQSSPMVYCLEERFDKLLLENNNRPNGIIFKCNLATYLNGKIDFEVMDLYFNSNLKFYNNKEIKKDPELNRYKSDLAIIWQSYMSGSLSVEEVFDLKKFASVFVVSDILNSKHGLSIHNTRLYYNPVTALIEPIAREWIMEKPNKKLQSLTIEGDFNKNLHSQFDNFYLRNKVIKDLYKSKELQKYYVEEANILTQRAYLDSILSNRNEVIQSMLSEINIVTPNYTIPLKTIYKNQRYIRRKIYPDVPNISAYVKDADSNKYTIRIQHLSRLPIFISKIEYCGKVMSEPNLILYRDSIDFKDIIVSFSKDDNTDFQNNLTDFKVFYDVYGVEKENTNNYIYSDVDRFVYVLPNKMMPLLLKEFLKKRSKSSLNHSLLEVDSSKRTVFFKNRLNKIHQNLIIPEGYTFHIKKGTEIDLLKGSSIISYSKIEFEGDSLVPIVVKSSDYSGKGVSIIDVNRKSLFKYVNFEGLNNLKTFSAQRGTINIFNSDLLLIDCDFSVKNSFCHVSMFNSNFLISKCSFSRCRNNSIEINNSLGIIFKTKLEADSSGVVCDNNSNLNIFSSKINNSYIGVKIKGESYVKINDVDIEMCEKGIEINEGSYLEIKDSELKGCTFAVNAPQQREEFLKSEIVTENLQFKLNNQNVFIENKSLIYGKVN